MERKKWTAREDVTESYKKFKDKRKWQLGLRRYIIEKNPSQFYAPYFGLGIEDFRHWIEIQFTANMNWDNFATAWQLDHIVPVAYFDFDKEEDLKLCWNFINIRVEPSDLEKNRGNRIDILAVKPYFDALFKTTGYEYCIKMVEKINAIQLSGNISLPKMEEFIIQHLKKIEEMQSFDAADFYNLNKGTAFKDILIEKAIFKKFS